MKTSLKVLAFEYNQPVLESCIFHSTACVCRNKLLFLPFPESKICETENKIISLNIKDLSEYPFFMIQFPMNLIIFEGTLPSLVFLVITSELLLIILISPKLDLEPNLQSEMFGLIFIHIWTPIFTKRKYQWLSEERPLF